VKCVEDRNYCSNLLLQICRKIKIQGIFIKEPNSKNFSYPIPDYFHVMGEQRRRGTFEHCPFFVFAVFSAQQNLRMKDANLYN
jgi:hypothetical protein